MISIDSYTITHYIERKHSYCCCLHVLIQKKYQSVILRIALKLMLNKQVRCVKKMNIISSKILKENKGPFMIHADFESILMLDDNGKQNPNDYYTI